MAMTADGKISRNPLEPVDWTGREDKKAFVRITRDAGVVIMGSRTFDTIGRPLPGRKNIVMTRDATRTSDHPDLVFTSRSPSKIIESLEQDGLEEAALIGGSVINTLFLQENLIHEIYVTIVPRLFGRGLSMFNKEFDRKMTLVDLARLDEDAVLLRYAVNPEVSFPS
jgi:dihydrofolate reductase